MKATVFILTFSFLIFSGCISQGPVKSQTETFIVDVCRGPAATVPSIVQLIPQELYGEEVLRLLSEVNDSTSEINFMQYNFFTDNPGDTYPKKIAKKLVELKKTFPNLPIRVALESRDGLKDPNEKGAAQRNAKTKAFFLAGNVQVFDVYGLPSSQQTPPSGKDGISHIKSVQIGDHFVNGSTNQTQQSTTPGSNNEMNISVHSHAIAVKLSEYFNAVVKNPGQMLNVTSEDGPVRMLTDLLIYDEYVAQIRKTQTGDSLGVAMYEFLYRTASDIQAKSILDELLSAHQRGVDVKVFLNRAHDINAQNTLTNLGVAETLLKAGIKVYFDPEAKISHSKYLVRVSLTEKIALIGSANFYVGDFNNNHQAAWLVSDPTVVDHLNMYFDQQVAYDGVLLSRIPVDPKTGLRYQKNVGHSPATMWNTPLGPTRMLRFWRGFRQDNIPNDTFRNNVNGILIPATTQVAAGRGLNAYLPSFFSDQKPTYIPDEVAIIDYVSEETYNGIRTTEPGRAYGPLHFSPGMFAKQNASGETSGSVVAVPYAGTVQIIPTGSAYMIGPADLNWQAGVAARRILIPTQGMSLQAVQTYIDSLVQNSQKLGLKGAVILVDPRYLMCMFNFNDASSASVSDPALASIEGRGLAKFDFNIFKSQADGKTVLRVGEGINIQFSQQLNSSDVNRQVVLNEIRGTQAQALQSKVQLMEVELKKDPEHSRQTRGASCNEIFNSP